jgi:hypothetical protein
MPPTRTPCHSAHATRPTPHATSSHGPRHPAHATRQPRHPAHATRPTLHATSSPGPRQTAHATRHFVTRPTPDSPRYTATAPHGTRHPTHTKGRDLPRGFLKPYQKACRTDATSSGLRSTSVRNTARFVPKPRKPGKKTRRVCTKRRGELYQTRSPARAPAPNDRRCRGPHGPFTISQDLAAPPPARTKTTAARHRRRRIGGAPIRHRAFWPEGPVP